MKNQPKKIVFQQNEFGKFGYVNADKKVIIPFEYDAISTFRHDGKTHFLVNQGTKFGIFDLNGKEVVEMTDAVNYTKLAADIKKMFKIVHEYSLSRERTNRLLLASFEKQSSTSNPTNEDSLSKTVLHSIFYDFIAKCYTLDFTKEVLLNTLTDEFVGIYSPFQGRERKPFSYPDMMKQLINLINDDEWCINFFTDYINEIIPVSGIDDAIALSETVDWQQHVIAYLMEIAA